MANVSQRDLIDAGKNARNAAGANFAEKGFAPEPPSKPALIENDAHPFAGNPNNMRVAQRLARETPKEKPLAPPLTLAQAAKKDLEKAAEYEAENPDEVLTSQEESAGETAAGKPLNTKLAPAASTSATAAANAAPAFKG